MDEWLTQIERTIRERKLFAEGESIVIAVSGGLDSMVLLNVLHALGVARRWCPSVAHFNHLLRGRSSDADERFVRKEAEALGLQFRSGRANVREFARASKLSIEMAARKLRHEFLARTARELNASTIALAHHADDQVELFLIRALRGAGGEGLAGMKWVSPSPAEPALRLVRPLLDQPRDSLAKFARRKRIPFREDVTNAQLDFQRNRVRHELLPLLRKYQPALDQTILRTMEIVRAESEHVARSAEAWLKGRRPRFSGLDLAVQRRVIQKQLQQLGVLAEFELIEQLRCEANRQVMVGSSLAVLRDVSGTVRTRGFERADFRSDFHGIDLAGGGSVRFGRLEITWSLHRRPGKTFAAEPNTEWFDADKVGRRAQLRHWRPGDRFQPIGMKSARKLQDLFVDLKIPAVERRKRVVAEAENGELFWVEGLRMAERFKLDNQTRRRLKWQWQFF